MPTLPYITTQLGIAQLGVAQLGNAILVPLSGTPTLSLMTKIPTRVAFGATSVAFPPQDLSLTTKIPTRVAFGATSLSVGLSLLYAIPSRVAFGAAAVTHSDYVSVLLAGVDVTKYVLDNTLNITNLLSQASTASFALWDPTGTIVPQVGQNVEVYWKSIRIFGGIVSQPFQSAFQANQGHLFSGSGSASSGGVGSATTGSGSSSGGVQCSDYSALLTRRYVGFYVDGASIFPAIPFLSSIVQYIVDTYLAADGFTYDDSDGDPGTNLGPQLFNWVTAQAAFNTLSSASGWDWSVDYYKVIRFYPATSGQAPAPFNVIEDNVTGRVPTVFAESLGVEYFQNQYRNMQGIISPTASSALWSDIYSGTQIGPFPQQPQPTDGIRQVFIQSYGFTSVPEVTVNGNSQTVGQLTGSGYSPPLSDVDWYIIQPAPGLPSYGLFQNPSHAPLTSLDTLVISYQSSLSPIYWVSNPTQIAIRAAVEGNSGVYQDVEQAPSVTDPNAIAAYAAGLLARYGNGIPFQVTYATKLPGLASAPLFAGMLQQIKVTNPALNFTGLITSVTIADIDGTYLQISVTVASGEYQGNFTYQQFFASLISQAQQPQPSAFGNYVFSIAPSNPGYVNPGTTGGQQPGTQVVRSPAELLYSFSVYLPPTSPANGTTAFNLVTTGSVIIATVTFLDGQSGNQTTYGVASVPIRLYVGDTLFINVGGVSANVKDAIATVVTSILVA